jgi:hypothetical protein
MHILKMHLLVWLMQDVVQFGPMGLTLISQMLADPLFVPAIFKHVGIGPMLDWLKHFTALGGYTALYNLGRPVINSIADRSGDKQKFRLHRLIDAWKYGSGLDFRL